MDLTGLAKLMAVFGIVLLIGAGVVYLLAQAGLPRLPGDILFKRGNTTVYIPIVTMIVVSIILTVILNLIFRK